MHSVPPVPIRWHPPHLDLRLLDLKCTVPKCPSLRGLPSHSLAREVKVQTFLCRDETKRPDARFAFIPLIRLVKMRRARNTKLNSA